MSTEPASATVLFLVGLLGAGHCVGMCGGITAALGMAGGGETAPGRIGLVLGYNLGRIGSYACAGLLAGGLGFLGDGYLALGPLLRGLAALLLILMGLYLGGWWSLLGRLEQIGAGVWRRVQPLGQKLLPVTGPGTALLLGGLWGWLPCGLVYSALAYAASSAHPVDGAILMMSFGLGTLPVMLVGGLFSRNLAATLQKKDLRQLLGIGIIAFGLWTLWAGLIGLHPSHSAAAPAPAGHQHRG